MGADVSRDSHNPLLDFAGVQLKQGGVVLDADFNESVAVMDRRLRAAASDILGPSTVSATTPDAFKITAAAGALSIGKGRLYVDGLLAENHGAPDAKSLFDPLMAEPTFADPVGYAAQPYLPSAPPLPETGTHLVYLDVWQRELTHLQRPELVETAVGVETSSRLQTVWQVRALGDDADRATCASPDDDVAGWSGLIAPSSGRLTTGTFDVPSSPDPCELPPTGGYRGLENQTYRVEIQDPGPPGTATFKWSRNNACVGSRVASMVSPTELELETLGRDDVLRFNTGDWVEIIDDVRELSRRCGEMRRVTVDEAARRITFAPALPDEMLPAPPTFPNSDFPRVGNMRVLCWDHKGKVLRAGPSGTTPQFQDLDDVGSTGVITVPPADTTLLLENGVTVSFAAVGTNDFRRGDYWIFAARTADASVELLDNAPPRGIHHHYARLGIWDVKTDTVTDCRTPWPPGGDGRDCSCTACVTPESHASGALTIQTAVDRIRSTGGTVCLGVGHYQLKEPVQLLGARSVRIKGEGAATVIGTPGGAFSISGGVALAIEDLAILSLGRSAVVSVHTALGLSLQRLLIVVPGTTDAGSAAIALAGAVIGATIRDNVIMAPVAVQAIDPSATPPTPGINLPPPQMLLTAALRIEDNVLRCERQAVALAGRVIHVLATRITGNDVVGCRQGAITALGLSGPGASMRIADNSLNVSGPGVTAGVDGLWIEGNKLVATPQRSDAKAEDAGITLRTGFDPSGADQCQILSNQISGFAGAAIAIQSPTRDLIVKLNVIERCGNGIVSEDEAKAASVSIENNHVSDIGSPDDSQAGSVVGIGVLHAGVATVAGNTIRRIGQKAERAPLRAGIAAVSVQRLRASGNDITGVAPAAEYLGLAAGVMLHGPFAQAEITFNHVDRDESASSQPSKSSWFAVLVEQPLGERLVSRIGTYAAVQLDAASDAPPSARRTLVFGARRPLVVTGATATDATGAVVVRGSDASVLGNVLAARGSTPAVELMISGDCLFNDNRCELRGKTRATAVRIAAGAPIINANRVRGGETSIELVGTKSGFPVLGNITTGAIVPKLPPPWDALNVIG